MSNIVKVISRTTTERHDVLAGTTVEQHKQYLADGFTYDRLARQYRRSKTERFTVDADGVLKPIVAEEVVAARAAA